MVLISQNGTTLLIWIIIFTVVCTGVLGLRFWAARILKRRPALDDYLVVFAYVNTIALEGTAIWAICNGLGAHTNELDAYQLGVQFKLILAAGVCWLLGTVGLKLSILALYIRIFSTAAFKRWAYAVMALVGGYGIAFLCVFMTNCQPISQQWDPVVGGFCRDIAIEEFTSVSINMVIDLAIVIMPMPVLWNLKMATRNKIFISLMFGIGFLTVGIMAWRIPVTIDSMKNPDFVFGFMLVALVSFLELWLGLIVACLPTLAPISNKYLKPKLTKLYYGASSNSGGWNDISLQRMTNNSSKQGKGSRALQTTEEDRVGLATCPVHGHDHGHGHIHGPTFLDDRDSTYGPSSPYRDPNYIRMEHRVQVDIHDR